MYQKCILLALDDGSAQNRRRHKSRSRSHREICERQVLRRWKAKFKRRRFQNEPTKFQAQFSKLIIYYTHLKVLIKKLYENIPYVLINWIKVSPSLKPDIEKAAGFWLKISWKNCSIQNERSGPCKNAVPSTSCC